MKYYANVSSERATKGQGGNEYIHITLQDETQTPVYFVGFWGHTLIVQDIEKEKELLRVETKGKQQKDEKRGTCGHLRNSGDCSECLPF